MTIQHKQSGNKGSFFINEEEEMVAELTYSMIPDSQMMIEHTQVDEQLRGGDLGYELVHTAIDYARSHKYTVIAVCRFAQAVLEKKPEFKDVMG
jgi:predicted GNAT family acetyltransferase